MTIPALIVVGIGLSMDAATITICNMLAYGSSGSKRKWLLPLSFGFFQGLMPLLGSFLGALLSAFITQYSNMVMFVIFGVIGGKMVWDGLKHQDADQPAKQMSLGMLFFQAIATSIDAFAVGVGFAASGVNAWYASTVIALTTFAVCAACLFLGEQAAKLLKTKASLGGGVILLIIAIVSLFS